MRRVFGSVFGLAMHWQILIAMAAGALLGVLLGGYAGDYQLPEPVEYRQGKLQVYGMADPVSVNGGTFWSHDDRGTVMIQVTENVPDDGGHNIRQIYIGPFENVDDTPTAEQDETWKIAQMQKLDWQPLPPGATLSGEVTHLPLDSVDELKSRDPAAYALFRKHGRSTSRVVADSCRLLGNLFLRLLRMVSVPLVIFSLLSGIMGLASAQTFGRMFGRTMLYYLATSTLAIIVGLTMVNVFRPGLEPPQEQQAEQDDGANAQQEAAEEDAEEGGKTVWTLLYEQIENMIPTNPIAAAADGNFLSLICFTLAFGIAALLAGGQVTQTTRDLGQAGFGAMMKLTIGVIRFAPIGVFGLMLYATASQGLGVFISLGEYMYTVAFALIFHACVVLPLIIKFVAKRSPLEFTRAMSPALFMAFSSSSSNATLPVTLASVEKRAGVSNKTSSFVLPLGATINMDGTALYETIAVIFIANVSGLELSVLDQIIIAYTALLVSIGAAGIPQAGLVMMIIILQAVGLPAEKQLLIVAVDRVLDMCRTVVNVWSDSCGCAVIDRFTDHGADDGAAEPAKEAAAAPT